MQADQDEQNQSCQMEQIVWRFAKVSRYQYEERYKENIGLGLFDVYRIQCIQSEEHQKPVSQEAYVEKNFWDGYCVVCYGYGPKIMSFKDFVVNRKIHENLEEEWQGNKAKGKAQENIIPVFLQFIIPEAKKRYKHKN